MPNLCSYMLKVKGDRAKCIAFQQVMINYDLPRHFWRVFEADIDDEVEASDGECILTISGTCAWSVYSCMCKGTHTYADDNPDSSTSLQEMSMKHHLEIEVYSEEDWIPVSDGNFTLPTAQIICAELGCGKAVSVLGHELFQESSARVWAEEFRCEGEEPELWVCPRVPCPGGTCHRSGAAQVVCSGEMQVRPVTSVNTLFR